MFQKTKIVQIIFLTVFVCLLVSGCKSRDNISVEEFTANQAEYREDMINFLDEGRDRSSLGLLDETKETFISWLNLNNLNHFNGFIDNLDNGFIPFLKQNTKDTIDYADSIISKLIEKFNIGEEENNE